MSSSPLNIPSITFLTFPSFQLKYFKVFPDPKNIQSSETATAEITYLKEGGFY